MRQSQLTLARYLRSPDKARQPPGVEPRRLAIYERLVYNNIENFISSGFPVLRSLYTEEDWHPLVREFIERHPCHTPYFLEIGQEFLQFLLEEYQRREVDPEFMAELSHYEWVELALDVAEQELPPASDWEDPLAVVPRLSPLAWLLSYRYPVQHIGPGFRPDAPGEPVYLVVYRDRADQVRFMELNAVTARLVELTRDNGEATGEQLLRTLAGETGMAARALLETGADQLRELLDCSVLTPVVPAAALDLAVAPDRPSA
jgi:hypothetical protein